VDYFKERLILIHHCRGVGWKSILKILQEDPLLDNLLNKTLEDWKIILPRLTNSQLSLFYNDLHSIDISQKIKLYKENKIEMITFFDEEYPTRLKRIFDPPWVIYAKGNIRLMNQKKILAVVGVRLPSQYGIDALNQIIPPIIKDGYIIVSGLAAGIDTRAHLLSIQNDGKTIGVIGGGLFHIYPKENTPLSLKMMKEHLVISETVPFRKSEPWMFPQRNRIISGLSDGVLIIEAKARSGSLITAYQALEQGREVFALPGNITSPNSRGTNELIQEGAKMVLSYNDIISEFKNDR